MSGVSNTIAERQAVLDERDRCAALCEDLAKFHEDKAKEERKARRGLIFKYVPAYNERLASYRDVAAGSLRTIARCIRAGYDPREQKPDPNVKVDITNMRGRLEINGEDSGFTVTSLRVEREDKPPAADKMTGPQHWYPCPECTSPMDCGSWATCMNSSQGLL